MDKLKFYITDVFAGNKYEGNQLAVFIDLHNQLPDADMQKITREINFAETTFIKQDKGNGRFVVRIFTPEHEVPFAGHPSLGTAFIISKFLLPKVSPELVLELVHSDIKITVDNPLQIDGSVLQMLQAQPEFKETFTHREIAEELEIGIDNLDISLPVQEITTGLPYIIIPLKSLKAIEHIKLNYASFQRFLERRKKYKSNSSTGHSTSLFFFTKQTYEAASTYNTRMIFLENDKLTEDAATGSANGCFLAYLVKYADNKIVATVEQGFQIKRKSYIYLDGELKDDQYQLRVGGRCQLISEGYWFI